MSKKYKVTLAISIENVMNPTMIEIFEANLTICGESLNMKYAQDIVKRHRTRYKVAAAFSKALKRIVAI